MGDEEKPKSGKELEYREFESKNFSFANVAKVAVPRKRGDLLGHATEYHYAEKYKNTEHVFELTNIFSEIISKLNAELNPSVSGKGPYVLGELNIDTHGRSGEYNLRFTPKDSDEWVSPEELEKYLKEWERTSPMMRHNLVQIRERLDSSSTIWLRGCNIGKYKRVLELLREMFWNKPKVCGYDLTAQLKYTYEPPMSNKKITSTQEVLLGKGGREYPEGTPEFEKHVICVP